MEPTSDVVPERDYAGLITDATRVLDEVDHALERIGDHTYGTCETCGEPMGDARLADQPTARWCDRHLPLAD